MEIFDFLRFLLDRSNAPPSVQFAMLTLELLIAVGLIWWTIHERYVKKELEGKLERASQEKITVQAHLDKLRGTMAAARDYVRGILKQNGELTERLGRVKQAFETGKAACGKEIQKRDVEIKDLLAELRQLEERFDGLRKVDSTVWLKAPTAAVPQFVDRRQRKTRFVSFLNLKGGVGKTTLVANLGAAYATGVTGEPRRVLVVDLDFQGTLSNSCVERNILTLQRRNDRTASALLGPGGGDSPDADLIPRLCAELYQAESGAQVIVAMEKLESVDFMRQAEFAVLEKEVRYFYRQLFHSAYVLQTYDLVLFDCPPRLTTSTMNALLTSDFIVVPTGLHPNDVDAVRRSLNLFLKFQHTDDFHAEFGGVIANRTYRAGTIDQDLTIDERQQKELLLTHLQEVGATQVLLQSLVPNKNEIARFAAKGSPIGASKAGHKIYGDLARELYERIRG